MLHDKLALPPLTFVDQIEAEQVARLWLLEFVPTDRSKVFWQFEYMSFAPHDGRVITLRGHERLVACVVITRDGLNRSNLVRWRSPISVRTSPDGSPLIGDELDQPSPDTAPPKRHPVDQVLWWACALKNEPRVGAINGALVIEMLESYAALLQKADEA